MCVSLARSTGIDSCFSEQNVLSTNPERSADILSFSGLYLPINIKSQSDNSLSTWVNFYTDGKTRIGQSIPKDLPHQQDDENEGLNSHGEEGKAVLLNSWFIYLNSYTKNTEISILTHFINKWNQYFDQFL